MTIKDSDILNLPDAPDFISESPSYTASEMIEICEKMLPYWNAQRYSLPEAEFLFEEFKLLD